MSSLLSSGLPELANNPTPLFLTIWGAGGGDGRFWKRNEDIQRLHKKADEPESYLHSLLGDLTPPELQFLFQMMETGSLWWLWVLPALTSQFGSSRT